LRPGEHTKAENENRCEAAISDVHGNSFVDVLAVAQLLVEAAIMTERSSRIMTNRDKRPFHIIADGSMDKALLIPGSLYKGSTCA